MPFNSAVPMASFPSKATHPTVAGRKSTGRAPLCDITDTIQNQNQQQKYADSENSLSSQNILRSKKISIDKIAQVPAQAPTQATKGVTSFIDLTTAPPSTPGKPRASSPTIPHHESIRLKNYNETIAVNKRISEISNDSKFDSPGSAREIKKHIGPWQLGCTLGEGSTGRVRKARHKMSGQVAAVKIMSKTEAVNMRSQSVMQMDSALATKPTRNTLPFGLEREIVIMKLINHPNITRLYDLWENRGEIYLVLEYVDGGELFGYIIERGRLEEAECIRIFRQLLSAVAYCHMFRVCHRDIKPENILMDRVGNIKLADFGMASREHIGGLNTSCGSPHYAPPEIACGEPYIGSQVDIWSCGVVLYVMIMGMLPFGNHLPVDDIEGVLNEIAHDEPEYNENMPPIVMDLVVRMLHKNPSKRIMSDDIWTHPLMKHYEEVAKNAPDPHRWIGGPPIALTTKDCGRGMQRADIDRDLLSGLCTLWHLVDAEEMMEKLMEDKPNYEKVIYRNLLSFRAEQEEKYYGMDLEYSDSDVHHVQRRPIRTQSRTSLLGPNKRTVSIARSLQKTARSRSSITTSTSRADLLGPQKRPSPQDPYLSSIPTTSSKFTIAAPPPRRLASKSSAALPPKSSASKYSIVPSKTSRKPSQASQRSRSTEKSYDPYRASSSGVPEIEADHARITVLGDSVSSKYGYASYAASLRRPAIDNLRSETSSAPSSAASAARDHNGNIRSLRYSRIQRHNSSSSWASTRMSSRSIRQFSVPSVRDKRQTQFSATKKRSPPPIRPRAPTPMTMQQKFRQGVRQDSMKDMSPAPIVVIKKNSIQSPGKKPQPKGFSLSPPTNVNRTSVLWEERTRQASMELSTLMDEVFSDQLDTELWDSEIEKEKQEEFVRRSLELPGLRGTGYSKRPLPDLPLKKPEAPPPSTDPAKFRSLYDADSVEELTRVKELLTARARDLGTTSLDPVIGHLSRLLKDKPGESSRRTASDPETARGSKHIHQLSPLKEEDESRHVSSPVRGKHGFFGKSNKSTIRMVDEKDTALYPQPLKIRKKASAPLLNSPQCKQDYEEMQDKSSPLGRLKMGASTSALDRLFKRDANKPGILLSSPTSSPEPSPIVEEFSKRASGDAKTTGKNWFKRSTTSLNSHHSAQSSEELDAAVISNARATDHPRSNTNTSSSDDFMFRMPKRESAGSKLLRFFKGQPKEKRMQIAIPDNEDGWYDSPIQASFPYGAVPTRRSRRNESTTSVSTPRTNTMSSRNGFGSISNTFAHLSSPHLYNTTATRDPFPTHSSNGNGNGTGNTGGSSGGGAVNLFARLFNLSSLNAAPTPQLICLALPRINAIHEIKSILRDWRRYGLTNVRVSKKNGTVRATVAESNTLGMQPVTLVAAVHAVAVNGNAGGLSIVKVAAEWGNRTSFNKACEALNGVLRGRGLLVRERHVAAEMKTALRDWERM